MRGAACAGHCRYGSRARPVAQAGDRDTGTRSGTAKPSVTCTDRSSVTCTGSQCHRGPIRRERLPPRLADQPRRSNLREQPLPPPQALQWPEPAERVSIRPSGSPHRSSRAGPHRGLLAGPDWAPRQALSAPNRPPRMRGRGHCLASPGQVLAWLASTLAKPAAGRISVPTGNRAQPVAGYLVCFPIACYGLTPRCREVKR